MKTDSSSSLVSTSDMSIRLVTHDRAQGQIIIREPGLPDQKRSTAKLVPNYDDHFWASSIHALGPGTYFVSTHIHEGWTGRTFYGISTEEADYPILGVDYGEILDQHPDDPHILLFSKRQIGDTGRYQDVTVGRVSYGPDSGHIKVLLVHSIPGHDLYRFAPGPIGPSNITRSGGFGYDYAGRIHHFRRTDKSIERTGPHPGQIILDLKSSVFWSEVIQYCGAICRDKAYAFYYASFAHPIRMPIADTPSSVHTIEDLTRWALPTMRAGLIAATNRSLSRYILSSY